MECTDKVSDKGHSLDVHFGLPGNVAVELYQPHYTKSPSGHWVAWHDVCSAGCTDAGTDNDGCNPHWGS